MSLAHKTVLIGRWRPELQSACVAASLNAGMSPALLLRTGTQCAVAIAGDKQRSITLYLRWQDARARHVAWALDPRMFSRKHESASLRAVADLLADPATPKRVIERPTLRRKTPAAVS